ncbi:MAG TPA: sigma 54-interacting transcriptional regulator [Kofleriaceae bacterium]|nr:sigma 54-interacting transcriptional regulator [Kofleriaceae bacterium]
MKRTVTGSDDGDAAGWVLLLTAVNDVRAVALPERGAVVIGRDPGCEVAIDHERLSRRHARLTFGGAWTVEDLGSRNGTRVRGEAVAAHQAVAVAPGEPLAIGPYTAVIVPRAVSELRAAAGGSSLVVDDPTLSSASPVALAVARSAINVLLLGETGSGKEVLARALHARSGRSGPLVAFNCAALAGPLVEAELFGHEKGAFTGAAAARVGLLEAAAGGTVVLDEIGDLPAEQQAKLLRAIETREVLRVGAVRPVPIDVRVIAATHRDLAREPDRFRRDLYYRLAGITLVVRPLRERRHDVARLAAGFAGGATFTPAALARLAAHDWPGNVRELKNVVERAVLLAAGGPVGPEQILLDPVGAAVPGPPAPVSPPAIASAAAAPADLTAAEAAERARIVAALEAHAGNQTLAARTLGISRATLVTRLRLYRIPRPRA